MVAGWAYEWTFCFLFPVFHWMESKFSAHLILFQDCLLPPERRCTKHTTPGGAKDISPETLPKTPHSWWVFSFWGVESLLWLEPAGWITAYPQKFSAGWRVWHLTIVQMRKLRPERGGSLPLSVTKLEVKQLPPPHGLCSSDSFLDSGVEGSRSGIMGFPWGRPEGRVVVEVEGSEHRWWMYLFSCDSGRGEKHKAIRQMIGKSWKFQKNTVATAAYWLLSPWPWRCATHELACFHLLI